MLPYNLWILARKHFPGHRGMAMPDRFWVKLKNQTNFELLSTGKILLQKIFQIFGPLKVIFGEKCGLYLFFNEPAIKFSAFLMHFLGIISPNLDYTTNMSRKIRQITD